MLKTLIKKFRKTFRPKDKKTLPEDAAVSPPADHLQPPSGSEDKTDNISGNPPRPSRPRKKKKSSQQPNLNTIPPQASEEEWSLAKFPAAPQPGRSRFHDLDLPLPIMHGISDLGYQYCTPIQEQILTRTLAGRDATGQAQTGTGKTAAFLLTIFARLGKNDSQQSTPVRPRALVLAPTRELAMQIGQDGQDLAKYCGLNIQTIFGGIPYRKQIPPLTENPVDLVVATPGRLLDFLRQKIIDLSGVEILVLDEADRLLDMGFIPDVRRIVNATPPKARRQTLFFSATMNDEVRHLASQWTENPVTVMVEPEQVTVSGVEQIFYLITAQKKFTLLYNLIHTRQLHRVMIFVNRRDEARSLTAKLQDYKLNCAMLSGDVTQTSRIRILEDFRHGKIRILVATDVASRGIHVDNVSYVINYFLPYEAEDYVHRIGRTGRAGAGGTAVSFACEEGSFYLPDIEQFTGEAISCSNPEDILLEPLPPVPPGTGSQTKPFKPAQRGRSNAGKKFPRKKTGGSGKIFS